MSQNAYGEIDDGGNGDRGRSAEKWICIRSYAARLDVANIIRDPGDGLSRRRWLMSRHYRITRESTG